MRISARLLSAITASFFLLARIVPAAADDSSQLLETVLGIQKISGITNPGEVNIRLVHVDRCSFGDVDALLLDSRWSGTAGRILLSLEPVYDLSNSGFVSTKEITPASLAHRGLEARLSVPKVKTPQLYGLFICRDSKNENSCRGKAVDDFKDIFARYKLEINAQTKELKPKALLEERKKTVPDRIYFFKSVIVDRDSLRISEKQTSDERAAQWANYLRVITGNSSDVSSEALARERLLNKILGSLPLRLTNKTIEISLPRFLPGKCK